MLGSKEVIASQYFQVGWKIFLIIVLAFIFRYILNSYFVRVKKKLRHDKKEVARVKKTRIELLKRFSSAAILIIAIILILFLIPGFKNIAYSMLAGAGIAAIVIGFAAQKTLGNVLAGISIGLYAPFRVGDKLKIFGEYGEVEDLNLRHTIIKTWDNKRLVVPNSKMDDKEIINFSLKGENILWTINMGISYDSDIDKARKIMKRLAKKHKNNLEFEENGEKKGPYVRVTECKDSSVNLRLYFWAEDVWKAWVMGFDLVESVKKEFDKKDIEIPFPYLNVLYKKAFKG